MASPIEQFLAMLAAERGAAANTLAAYRRDLEGAEELLGDLANADREALASLAGSWADLAPSSVARKTSALDWKPSRTFKRSGLDWVWPMAQPRIASPNRCARNLLSRSTVLAVKNILPLARSMPRVKSKRQEPMLVKTMRRFKLVSSQQPRPC